MKDAVLNQHFQYFYSHERPIAIGVLGIRGQKGIDLTGGTGIARGSWEYRGYMGSGADERPPM